MTVVRSIHDDHGASYRTVGDRAAVASYGRPERAHHAVRKVVGVLEMAYGVVTVAGADRLAFLENTVSNRVPDAEGAGQYAFLLTPEGRVDLDCYLYHAGERVLVFVPPGRADELADAWRDRTFVQDVSVASATGEFGVFGVHGPKATEKIASVLNNASAPGDPLSFVRGSIRDAGVTVVRSDNPPGEEGYEVVCAADDAPDVFDSLLYRGLNATPFGYDTWDALTLEAGTPNSRDLAGSVPNVLGARHALDFEKGCYVGQEVVARVENHGRPSRRVVGLRTESVPDRGADVRRAGERVGEVLRGAESPMLERPVALALVEYDLAATDLTAAEDSAAVVDLPFVEGSARSLRLPEYPGG